MRVPPAATAMAASFVLHSVAVSTIVTGYHGSPGKALPDWPSYHGSDAEGIAIGLIEMDQSPPSDSLVGPAVPTPSGLAHNGSAWSVSAAHFNSIHSSLSSKQSSVHAAVPSAGSVSQSSSSASEKPYAGHPGRRKDDVGTTTNDGRELQLKGAHDASARESRSELIHREDGGTAALVGLGQDSGLTAELREDDTRPSGSGQSAEIGPAPANEDSFTDIARPLDAIVAYPDWTLVDSGKIHLKLVISAQGVVESTSVLISSGSEPVDDAFREASAASLFSPCQSGTTPVKCTIGYHWKFSTKTLENGLRQATFCGSVDRIF